MSAVNTMKNVGNALNPFKKSIIPGVGIYEEDAVINISGLSRFLIIASPLINTLNKKNIEVEKVVEAGKQFVNNLKYLDIPDKDENSESDVSEEEIRLKKFTDNHIVYHQETMRDIAEGDYDLSKCDLIEERNTTRYTVRLYDNNIIVIKGITKEQTVIDPMGSVYLGCPVTTHRIQNEGSELEGFIHELYHPNGTIVAMILPLEEDYDVVEFMNKYIPSYYSPLTSTIPSIMTEISRKVPTEQKVNNQISDIPIQDKMDLGEDDDMPKSNGKKK